jgi:hypothetical protein
MILFYLFHAYFFLSNHQVTYTTLHPFCRNDILENFKKETKKAIDYMGMNQSRVAITTDMWTADSTKKGYMVITAHFIDDSWKLRSIIMRY